ncbi:MAG: hypothetical protein WCF66_08835 [Pseudolabrys sp.]
MLVVRYCHYPNVTVSKKIDAPYRSGPPKSWIKVNNPEVSGSNASY